MTGNSSNENGQFVPYRCTYMWLTLLVIDLIFIREKKPRGIQIVRAPLESFGALLSFTVHVYEFIPQN